MEVPGQRLPLFKFREMFENRFMTSVSVSDLYKMKDVCLITEEPNHRIISLNPEYRNTPSPILQPSMPVSHLVSFTIQCVKYNTFLKPINVYFLIYVLLFII